MSSESHQARTTIRSSADDSELLAIAAKVDRNKAMWFAASGAAFDVAVSELYGGRNNVFSELYRQPN